MRHRFATGLLNGWDDPPYAWLQAVQRHARYVWVRLAGLNEHEYAENGTHVMQWESAASRLCPNRGTCAFLVIQFNRVSRNPPWRFGLSNPSQARRRWPETMVLADRLDVLLRIIRAGQPHPVGVFADDFAARWLAESGFLPDTVVLDNPIISLDEARGRWAKLFARPGYSRLSHWPSLGAWESWGMHFDVEQIAGGVPSPCRHATWRSLSPQEIAHCRERIPAL
jgi:hypothetical protein